MILTVPAYRLMQSIAPRFSRAGQNAHNDPPQPNSVLQTRFSACGFQPLRPRSALESRPTKTTLSTTYTLFATDNVVNTLTKKITAQNTSPNARQCDRLTAPAAHAVRAPAATKVSTCPTKAPWPPLERVGAHAIAMKAGDIQGMSLVVIANISGINLFATSIQQEV